MSDRNKRRPKVCGMCGRISKRDLERHYCPFTAFNIYINKPADSCSFFVKDEDARGRRGDVRR